MIRHARFALVMLAAQLVSSGTVSGQQPLVLPPIVGLDEFVPTPDDNPLSLSSLVLGRRLFFDRRLSRDGTRACASCHSPIHGFADNTAQSVGVGGAVGRRNAPAIINRAWGSAFFWDGRSESLERQVLEPVRDQSELNLTLQEAIERVRSDSSYIELFRNAFGTSPDTTNLARALASYVRTIRSGASRVDRFRAGEMTALSESERRGMELFSGDARCSRCHIGSNFTDEEFHNTGVGWGSGDVGREGVTQKAEDRGRFKTPTLRDVSLTTPFMHDGSLPTIEAVIEFYNRGGGLNPNLDRDVRPLNLTPEQKTDLAAFLRALTSRSISCQPIECVPPES